MYRLGWPGATFFAKMGIPLLIKVEIIHDNEANVYVATSLDLKGLVVEAETLDGLEKEVWDLVPELLTLDRLKLHIKAVRICRFFSPLLQYDSHEIWVSEKDVSVTVNHVCKSRHTAIAS